MHTLQKYITINMETIKAALGTGGYVFVLTVLILRKLIPFGMWKIGVISKEKLGEGAAPTKYCYQHYLKHRWQGGIYFLTIAFRFGC